MPKNMNLIANGQKVERYNSAMLDNVLGLTYRVLDHGFIRVVDYMGNDASIVQAARVSYSDGTMTLRKDKGLIDYLMAFDHMTPFEMCEIKFHVKMPIFVARQWVRHRTASINEVSARYSVLKTEFYLPSEKDIGEQSQFNKQGRDPDAPLASDMAEAVQALIETSYRLSGDAYRTMTDTADGEPKVARELARLPLPVATYTQWYWKVNLRNLLHFLHLRTDEHAQAEIRAYANVMWNLAAYWVPWAMESWERHVKNAVKFSADEMVVLRHMIENSKDFDEIDFQSDQFSLSERQIRELQTKTGWL